MKKTVLLLLLAGTLSFNCQARTSESVHSGEGIGPYNGWIVADMSMESGVVSSIASYSMRTYKDYGLIPVAYCSSGGRHLGSYYTYYVNPYNDCLIIGRSGMTSHSTIYDDNLKSYSETGKFIRYTDIGEHQDLYRRIIDIGKAEFIKYQNMLK